MKTSKKIIIAVIAVLVVVAAALGITYAVLSHKDAPELDKSATPNTAVASGITYAVAEAPFSADYVLETNLGMESYWRANRKNGNALEVVLQCTKDNEIVVLSTDLNETSNAQILFGQDASVRSLTLDELKTVNLCYNLQNEDGAMPYAGYSSADLINQVNVLSLQDFLDYYGDPIRARFCLYFRFYDEKEIPDYKAVLDKLYTVCGEMYLYPGAVFCTSNADIAAYIDTACPELQRVATEKELSALYTGSLTGKAQEGLSYEVVIADADSRFATEQFVHYAKNLGLSVLLKDADAEDYRKLYDFGINGLITQDVEGFAEVIVQARKEEREARTSTAAQ